MHPGEEDELLIGYMGYIGCIGYEGTSAKRTSCSSASLPERVSLIEKAAQQPGRSSSHDDSAHVSMSWACSVRPFMIIWSLMRPTMYSRSWGAME